MAPYILREMLQHLLNRLLSTLILFDLLKKREEPTYDMILIAQKERTIAVNAMMLGAAFGALAIWLVLVIKGSENIMIVIAGIFLSFGLVQQIVSVGLDTVTMNLGRFMSSWNSILNTLAKHRNTPEWQRLRDATEEIFVFPQIIHALPYSIKENSSVEAVTSYLDEHRWELGYPQTIFGHDEKSLLSFSNYAIEVLRNRMDVYDRLLTMQQRTGTVNPVVFVAAGTLIWLLS